MGKLGNEKENASDLNSGIQETPLQWLDSLPSAIQGEISYMLRIGNACAHYYNEVIIEPTEQDFGHWLASLPESVARQIAAAGYDRCKDLIALRLDVADRNKAGLDAYLKSRLSAQDYQRWSTMRARSM